ncbi:MAG TPA: spore germination protein, partial [Clostridia bacterium]
MDSKYINESLSINKSFLITQIGESYDTKYRYFKIPAFDNSNAFVVFLSGMIDSRIVEETILEPLMNYTKLPQYISKAKSTEYASLLMEHGIFTAEANRSRQWDEICDAIMEGDTVLLIESCPDALIISSSKYEGRSVEEPSTESEIKGPRDGFVENIQTNVMLIRRRIKDYSLRFDNMIVGERTKTVVLVAYLKSLVDEALLTEVKKRLEGIDVDGVIATEYVQELIEDSPYSLFPKIMNTERPDRTCAALLEGRVIVMVDNTPYVLIMPSTFWEFMTSSGD